MNQICRRTALVFLGILAGAAFPACESLDSIARPKVRVDSQTDAVFGAMTDKLASSPELRFRTRNTYDPELVMHGGMAPELAVEVAVVRPNRFQAKADGRQSGEAVYFDGRTLTIYNGKENLYAAAPVVAADIDGALDIMAKHYGFTPPLADFIAADPFKAMTYNMTEGRYVGKETVRGMQCHRLAFTGEEVDWELWISALDQLPRRYIITVKKLEGSPRFTAEFLEWDLDPDLPDSRFRFRPPSGAVEIKMLKTGDTPFANS